MRGAHNTACCLATRPPLSSCRDKNCNLGRCIDQLTLGNPRTGLDHLLEVAAPLRRLLKVNGPRCLRSLHPTERRLHCRQQAHRCRQRRRDRVAASGAAAVPQSATVLLHCAALRAAVLWPRHAVLPPSPLPLLLVLLLFLELSIQGLVGPSRRAPRCCRTGNRCC